MILPLRPSPALPRERTRPVRPSTAVLAGHGRRAGGGNVLSDGPSDGPSDRGSGIADHGSRIADRGSRITAPCASPRREDRPGQHGGLEGPSTGEGTRCR
ncbi:hypothetical protein DZF98_00505 [Clavibacter californiensis]|uniref:Uncharacterized protein n=1 Tax=Clavibacter californiensis TaxID=1401995 RepID=A0ABX9NA08_9MICO|nr:hypothetical protein DZF98_00505 [Clavibacter californiensis]